MSFNAGLHSAENPSVITKPSSASDKSLAAVHPMPANHPLEFYQPTKRVPVELFLADCYKRQYFCELAGKNICAVYPLNTTDGYPDHPCPTELFLADSYKQQYQAEQQNSCTKLNKR